MDRETKEKHTQKFDVQCMFNVNFFIFSILERICLLSLLCVTLKRRPHSQLAFFWYGSLIAVISLPSHNDWALHFRCSVASPIWKRPTRECIVAVDVGLLCKSGFLFTWTMNLAIIHKVVQVEKIIEPISTAHSGLSILLSGTTIYNLEDWVLPSPTPTCLNQLLLHLHLQSSSSKSNILLIPLSITMTTSHLVLKTWIIQYLPSSPLQPWWLSHREMSFYATSLPPDGLTTYSTRSLAPAIALHHFALMHWVTVLFQEVARILGKIAQEEKEERISLGGLTLWRLNLAHWGQR